MILEHGEEDGLKRKKHGGRLKIKPYVLRTTTNIYSVLIMYFMIVGM
jgi:hypothetical protein